VAGADSRTWVLTGSRENYAVTHGLGLRLVGLKERRRRQAEQMEQGDRVVYYLTKRMCFAASVLITGDLFEDHTAVWPGKPGRPDPYPWRLEAEPELVLEEAEWLAAETLIDDLEHIRKWPREHWKLAFQGQLRTISTPDSEVLAHRMGQRAGLRA